MSDTNIKHNNSVWTDTKVLPNILILNQQQLENKDHDKLKTNYPLTRLGARLDTM